MKKLTLLFLSLVALTATFVSCSKDEEAPAPVVTSLELTINDENGTLLPGAKVILLDSPSAKEPTATGTADNNGKVKFDNLKPIVYYFIASKDCKSNLWLPNYLTTKDPLVSGKNTTFNVRTESTGYLLIKNNSSSAYNISFLDRTSGDALAWLKSGKIPNVEDSEGKAVLYPTPIPASVKYTLKAEELDSEGNPTGTVIEKDFDITCNTPSSGTPTTVELP